MRLPPQYKRLYFHHVRRVGGTSLNQSFFALRTSRPEFISENLRRSRAKSIVIRNTVFVGANRELLEEGGYFYGFSHIPAHRLKLPTSTFTIALFRDPLERVISHYRMILDHESRGLQRSWLALERQWLGGGFADFLANLPRERLLAQLFTFSATFDVPEALDQIRRCTYFFHSSRYRHGLAKLSSLCGLPLKLRRAHRSSSRVGPLPRELVMLRELLEPEYRLLGQLWNGEDYG